MKKSQLFTKISKDIPADETAKNAQLLIQAGFIHKEMAGVYAFLPLGKRVLDKIVQIIREEMNKIGGQEISLTALQAKETWQATNRWSDEVMDVWFKTKLASGSDLGLAPTHEEPITKMMKNFIHSYKDLPVYPYQFQTKFRNELRSKSGLMRGREFLMKDLYSFSLNKTDHDLFYEEIAQAYHRIFARLGIGDITYQTFASGGSFAKYSHEFQTISAVGEDLIYVDKKRRIAVNQEVYNEQTLADLNLNQADLEESKAVEVGNIFTLGTKFSDALDLNYTDKDGVQKAVFMGSYGIGPSRLMGLLAEHFADDKGLNWPINIAPFEINLINLNDKSKARADQIYQLLTEAGFEVLYDDREERAGAKFAEADLIGIPYRCLISPRLMETDQIEIVKRSSGETEILTLEQAIDKLKQVINNKG